MGHLWVGPAWTQPNFLELFSSGSTARSNQAAPI
jgi:hypothetical protein